MCVVYVRHVRRGRTAIFSPRTTQNFLQHCTISGRHALFKENMEQVGCCVPDLRIRRLVLYTYSIARNLKLALAAPPSGYFRGLFFDCTVGPLYLQTSFREKSVKCFWQQNYLDHVAYRNLEKEGKYPRNILFHYSFSFPASGKACRFREKPTETSLLERFIKNRRRRVYFFPQHFYGGFPSFLVGPVHS